MTPLERAEKEDLLKRMNVAIIDGKLEDYLKTADDQKPIFEIKLTRLCVRYQKIKKELEG